MTIARNRASLATAKTIPIFLALLVAYSSYVVVGPLAVNYLLHPPASSIQRRVTAGIAIPIVYFILVIPVAATWLRLLVIVWSDSGYIPLGDSAALGDTEPAPGLEAFYHKDVFCCDPRGRPIWCHHCQNWKTDRAHHNQDVGRCTMKMDHFCPWVGGVVGERSYKFFVQFMFYGVILTAFTMSCLAYFVAERVRKGLRQDVQWLIVLGIAGFFCIFAMGMVGNSLSLTFQNLTTIENLSSRSRTELIAVLLPPEYQSETFDGPPSALQSTEVHDAQTSRLNNGRTSKHEVHERRDHNYAVGDSQLQPPRRTSTAHRIWKGTVTYPLSLPIDRPPLPAPELRKFAILETLPGMNIWDLGSAWLNFKSVFGSRPHEWVLPIRFSPCCDHSGAISQYALGPDFDELLVEVGLVSRHESLTTSSHMSTAQAERQSAISRKRGRKRKRRLDAGWKNGERPDGWIPEKEARRARRQRLADGQ